MGKTIVIIKLMVWMNIFSMTYGQMTDQELFEYTVDELKRFKPKFDSIISNYDAPATMRSSLQNTDTLYFYDTQGSIDDFIKYSGVMDKIIVKIEDLDKWIDSTGINFFGYVKFSRRDKEFSGTIVYRTKWYDDYSWVSIGELDGYFYYGVISIFTKLKKYHFPKLYRIRTDEEVYFITYLMGSSYSINYTNFSTNKTDTFPKFESFSVELKKRFSLRKQLSSFDFHNIDRYTVITHRGKRILYYQVVPSGKRFLGIKKIKPEKGYKYLW